ncbi:MAG: T9SS C-terminal target domain-containing protein [Ignavibacteriae bacterium]|nr:MAG: T9SS C-terminal target domain-containing protein [Ignavibacteriota bacterium]
MKIIPVLILLLIIILNSNITHADWTEQQSPVTSDLIGASAVNQDICWMCGNDGAVIRTTNGGAAWILANTGLTTFDFASIFAIDANNCWLGGQDGTLRKTTNGGLLWEAVPLTPASQFIDAIYFFDSNLGFVLGDPVNSVWGFYITTNGGAIWTAGENSPAAPSGEAGWNNSFCALDTGHIWWGTNNSKIYKGSFRGPFTSAPTTGAVNSFCVAFNYPLTGVAAMATASYTGLNTMLSTDGGMSWNTSSYLPAGIQYGIKGIPGTPYIWMTGSGLFSGHVLRSTDNGNWFDTQFSFVPGNAGGCISMVNENCGWAATLSTESNVPSGRIYKYTDNIGIANNNEVPSYFKLEQNYPNPFNPTTTINYSVPVTSEVSIKVYDMLGHEILTLVKEQKNAGNYSVVLNASELASGIYFYKLTAGSFIDTKKISLVK